MRRHWRLLGLTAVVLVASGYAGSREVFFGGWAGGYPVRIVIQTPGVIPGLADISIRTPDEVDSVSVQPLYWSVPPSQAPAPDPAVRSGKGAYRGQLWMMASGSYGVRVTIAGPRGLGSVVVPVTAVAYERLDMDRGLGLVLLALAAFLAAGLVTIVRSAARESTLQPGSAPDRRSRKRGWIGLGAGTLVVGLAVFGGQTWWNAVDTAYRGRLYRPPALQARAIDQGRTLAVEVRDSSWLAFRRRRPLGTDTHIFLAGDSTFAHLHPDEREGVFTAGLPPLSEKEYRVFMEITDTTGFTETLTGSFPRDGAVGRAARPGAGAGITVSLVEGDDLTFELKDADGRPLLPDSAGYETADIFILEPDGQAVHLRPHGTSSNSALAHFRKGTGDWGLGAGDYRAARPTPGRISFPYPSERAREGRMLASFVVKGKPIVTVCNNGRCNL